MSKVLGGIGLLFVLATLFFGVKYSGVFETEARQGPTTKQENWRGHSSPDVKFKGLKDGTFVSLSKFKNSVILVNFWASWCGPCEEEFPAMLRLLDHFNGELQMVAVSNDSKKSSIYKFLKKFEKQYSAGLKGKNLHLAWDPTLEITQEHFNVLRLPETFILDRNHKIVRKVIGVTEWDGPKMKSYIQSLLTP